MKHKFNRGDLVVVVSTKVTSEVYVEHGSLEITPEQVGIVPGVILEVNYYTRYGQVLGFRAANQAFVAEDDVELIYGLAD